MHLGQWAIRPVGTLHSRIFLVTSESHYTVLARRFRPQAFDDVVGQEHVSRGLRNAILSGRAAHAYLFTGARGVGKTSIARIFAKALNCPHAVDAVPCNACEICEAISAGNDVDVLEIDGASNRRIEDIRSIRANVGVRSMRTRFKVYIIDEVHMLTREAFNALLKTLEEPPPNVKFVFCTTEPEKVPDTIRSRCIRYDFAAIEDRSISRRLKDIAVAEGFDVEDEAIDLVARRARGSMRDSQSLFDQLLAFSDGTVTAADVHRMLGTAGDDLLTDLFDQITQQQPGQVLNLVDEALKNGVQTAEFLDQCIGYVRDMMVLNSQGAAVPLCSVGESRRSQVEEHSRRMGLPNVMAAFQILSETKNRMFRSTFSRALLEMSLVQISLLENLSAVSDLLSGRLPDLPATAPAATEHQKKTADLTDSQSASEESAEPDSRFPFTQDAAAVLMEQLKEETSPTLSGAIRKAKELRICEPNRVEFVLDASSAFQKRVLETPDSQQAIRQIIHRMTRVQPVVSVRTLSDGSKTAASGDSPPAASNSAGADRPGSAPARRPPAASAGRPAPSEDSAPSRPGIVVRDDIDPTQDPFVQEVAQVFGATVHRVINAPVRPKTG